MKFIQTLEEKDLLFLNTYLSKNNIKEKFLIILIPILSLVSAILCFTKSYIVFGIIFLVCGVFFGFGLSILKKRMILNKSKEGAKLLEGKEIEVTIDEKGLLYAFTTEDIGGIEPFIWGDLLKVTKMDIYYIIEINYNTVILIKPNNIEEDNYIKNLCEKELILGIRYFEK